MKKSHILGITLLAIWAITLIAFLGHYFIRPILPEYVSSIGLVAGGLLFGVMGFLSLFNDTLDLSHKLFGSISESQTKQLDRESINLYPHRNPPYNAVKMLYSGAEMVKDFEAHVIYKDANGNKRSKEIQEFFPEQDPQMIWHYYKYDFLKPNQVAYFRLVKRKTAPDGKVKVLVSFKGASSGTPVKFEKEFKLEH